MCNLRILCLALLIIWACDRTDTPAPTEPGSPIVASPSTAPAAPAARSPTCSGGGSLRTLQPGQPWSGDSDDQTLAACLDWQLTTGPVAVELVESGDEELILRISNTEVRRFSVNLARGTKATVAAVDAGELAVTVRSAAGSQDEGDAHAARYRWDPSAGRAVQIRSWSGSDLENAPAWVGQAGQRTAAGTSPATRPLAELCRVCSFLDRCDVLEAELFGTSEATCPAECTERARAFFECLAAATDCQTFGGLVDRCRSLYAPGDSHR